MNVLKLLKQFSASIVVGILLSTVIYIIIEHAEPKIPYMDWFINIVCIILIIMTIITDVMR